MEQMTRLQDIEPVPISSMLQRNWQADAPPWVIGALVATPALFLSGPVQYVIPALGVVAGVAADIALSRLRQKWRIQEATTPPSEFPSPVEFDPSDRALIWQALTADPSVRSLVQFSYGTCVVSVDDVDDPIANAKQLLSEYGHAIPGTPSADMLVYTLPETGDFVVGCYHPNILTYIPRELFVRDASTDEIQTPVAYLGRDFRCLDTFAQESVHVHRSAS